MRCPKCEEDFSELHVEMWFLEDGKAYSVKTEKAFCGGCFDELFIDMRHGKVPEGFKRSVTFEMLLNEKS